MNDSITGPAEVDLERAWTYAYGHLVGLDILHEIPSLYWELAPPMGIRPEVAFAQAMLETGNFSFPRCGITVCADYHNPCGMRTRFIEGPESPLNHQRFSSWHEGVQAHLDHLGLYVGLHGFPKPATETPDPRHFAWLFGKVTSITTLGDWWVTGGAGTRPAYGASIRAFIERMKEMEVPPIDLSAQGAYILSGGSADLGLKSPPVKLGWLAQLIRALGGLVEVSVRIYAQLEVMEKGYPTLICPYRSEHSFRRWDKDGMLFDMVGFQSWVWPETTFGVPRFAYVSIWDEPFRGNVLTYLTLKSSPAFGSIDDIWPGTSFHLENIRIQQEPTWTPDRHRW